VLPTEACTEFDAFDMLKEPLSKIGISFCCSFLATIFGVRGLSASPRTPSIYLTVNLYIIQII